MPDSDWAMYKIPGALQRTIVAELDTIGGGRSDMNSTMNHSQSKQQFAPVHHQQQQQAAPVYKAPVQQ